MEENTSLRRQLMLQICSFADNNCRKLLILAINNAKNELNQHLQNRFKYCLQSILLNDEKIIEKQSSILIDTIVDQLYEVLHTGHWTSVKLATRQAYAAAAYVKVLVHLANPLTSLEDIIRFADLGLMLGYPIIINDENETLLSKTASLLNEKLNNFEEKRKRKILNDENEGNGEEIIEGKHKKVEMNEEKHESVEENHQNIDEKHETFKEKYKKHDLNEETSKNHETTEDKHGKNEENEGIEENYDENAEMAEFEEMPGKPLSAIKCPSMEAFSASFFSKQLPVKLTDCISHWPAMHKWRQTAYLLRIAGSRTVPVEVGTHYAADNWSQRLMTLREFIQNYYYRRDGKKEIGYLAQHNLFDQIPELRADIHTPEYCCLPRNPNEGLNNINVNNVDINAWLGPAGTLSPLHYDPKDNLLAQVYGCKLILLIAPAHSAQLAADTNSSHLLANTSTLTDLNALKDLKDISNGDLMAFKCLLKHGEMVYIPPKWWHHVRALRPSFSVSFWWE